ncbi:MAG: penicillin-binding protein 1C [Variovorax paradoxus]|nr:MAG: penicillin-binding protein 1C [Variovorax paradoxus]PZQ09508.1 MAG: penicillin-binding protein 1C [Variovorax paradoxus]
MKKAWLGVVLACASTLACALPSYDEVRSAHRPSETLVLARDGQLLQRVRTDASVRRGPWTTLAEVSPALRTALVLSEDQFFWQHSGVDWRAVSAAAWANLWNTRTRGASTLTMQLAGLLDEDWRAGPGGRSIGQKLGQAVAAQRLERSWRKDQILEAYLNLVPLRGEIVGIDALARSLFGKAPHGLDAREAAIAAALVRGPNAAPVVVARRACSVLKDSTGAADCAGLELLTLGALQRRGWAAGEGIAPHFARRLLHEDSTGAPSLRSSLDADLQRFAQQQLAQHLRELRGRNVEDGALVVLDNASGEVLAWVGSSGALSRAAEVDGVLAQRQPGSTLKPFLYAQAIAERRLTAASLLEDAPTHIATPAGLYIPQNYDRRFKGWVSVRTALASSLNVPAVRTLVMVSPDAFARQLQALGLALAHGGDHYGTSLALGSAEVSLLALTNGYRALANGGHAGPVRLQPGPRPAPGPAVLDARAAFVVGDILADPLARALTFGTDSVLATRGWAAVKTGTSKDMRDNWAVGWSERYTVGVWVGNAGGAAMWDVSGTSGAAPIWAALMQQLHRQAPSRAPRAPAGVEQTAVRFGDALEAPRREWFLPGTAQPEFALARTPDGRAASPRILAPVDGSIVALDPDIPPAHQRLWLRAQGVDARWRMDGKPLGRGRELAWLPWPGRHQLQLVDGAGAVLDEVRIEVRGAAVKPRGKRPALPGQEQ